MSTNYHAPIGVGAPANAAVLNSPLEQLDSAIGDVNARVTAGTTQNYYTGATAGFSSSAVVGALGAGASFVAAAGDINAGYAILSVNTTSAELVTITGVAGTTYTATVTGSHSNGAPIMFLSTNKMLQAEWFGLLAATTNANRRVALQKTLTAGGENARILLPPGSFTIGTPDADGYFLRCYSGQEIVGSGIASVSNTTAIVIEASSTYKAVFAATGDVYTTSLTGLTIRNLAIDQNGPSNNTVPTGPNDARVAILIHSGEQIRIEGCRFHRSISINTIIANGSNVKRVHIVNNHFTGVGNAVTDFDHSTIYTHATDVSIVGNTFTAQVTLGNGARTAIETHGARTTVRGNMVNGYWIGMNITGVTAAKTSNVQVASNGINNCMFGILLWSYAYGVYTSGYALDGVSVTGNTINIINSPARPAGQSVGGIVFEPNSNLPVRNVVIANNTVATAVEGVALAPNTASIGIGFWSINNVEIGNLVIANNIVDNFPGPAIRLSGGLVNNCVVTGNAITNPGNTLGSLIDAYRCGIFVWGDTVRQLQIASNMILDTVNTTRMVYGIVVQTTTGGYGVQIMWNTAAASGATTTAFVAPVYTTGANTKPLVLGVHNNFTVPATMFAAGSRIIDDALGLEFFNIAGSTTWVARGFGTAAPVSGTWRRGDIVWNYTPSASGYAGWICVTAGSPGTWKGFGVIQA